MGGHHAGVGGLLQKLDIRSSMLSRSWSDIPNCFIRSSTGWMCIARALGQAVALLDGLAVFQPLHKDDGRAFLAFNTKHILHLYGKCRMGVGLLKICGGVLDACGGIWA